MERHWYNVSFEGFDQVLIHISLNCQLIFVTVIFVTVIKTFGHWVSSYIYVASLLEVKSVQ